MTRTLLKTMLVVLSFTACTSSRNNSQSNEVFQASEASSQPSLAPEQKPQSLLELPQTQDGGFILKPGFYEAEFKTYCLQPGTPDPRQGDAYFQGPLTGYRKDIIESVLRNSGSYQQMDQKNIQLLLWSVVSGSDFKKLSYSVQADAVKLLTPKQIFELNGGVVGMIKEVSSATGLLKANSDMRRLFETSMDSYEAYERIAVRREPSQVIKKGVKYDQWYQQKENYFVRYFPESYQRMKIQVFVPDGLLDEENKRNKEYVVFDPTAKQALPAFTNAQRLGIGSTVIHVIREVIRVNKVPAPPKKKEKKTESPKS